MPEVLDFNAIHIYLASPEQIRMWSYGEVTKPETINYRTLKPAKDGLFCEKIFGPTKDFECYCGKYKKAQYAGVTCDRCGVLVTKSEVRRERMGHIELNAPVAHVWFLKGTPNPIALLLNLSPRNLEKVLYFVQYIVTSVDEQARKEALAGLQEEGGLLSGDSLEKIERAAIAELQRRLEALGIDEECQEECLKLHQEIVGREQKLNEKKLQQKKDASEEVSELEGLDTGMLLSETRFRELSNKYPDVFEANMGAEAILELLRGLDLKTMSVGLWQEVNSSSGQRRKKAMKRLEIVEAFLQSGNRPEWMVLTVLPVLPPDLRPMIQLDGGRFASADPNDLYRRVINRNNRLKKLLALDTPRIIVNNEKRMLQEAVDALLDSNRRGRVGSTVDTRPLKSLSDMLRGKQGRFRQNLLGKRVDYSGRSVIVVGPELKLHQCGLPKRMALELFKPFVMSQLMRQGIAANIKSAKRMVEQARTEVWDILDNVVKDRPVLLNRAPTLHRLGIQAFEPVLIEGNAIQVHPLVCAAFNADFDGDQMAVHVPLSKMAVREAREAMLSTHNTRLPSSGEPTIAPTLDIVLGCYYLTSMQPGLNGEGRPFSSFEEVRLAYDLGIIDLRAEIETRQADGGAHLKTTAGRVIFNDMLPAELRFINETMDKTRLKQVITHCIRLLGNEAAATLADNIKQLGFQYATKSGISIGITDTTVPQGKAELLHNAEVAVNQIDQQYHRGLITEDERYSSTVQIWIKATDDITTMISKGMDRFGAIYMMSTSGAKGNIGQIRQMVGMRGLMTDPLGKIIDFPIKSSFREGLPVLEYFISTHGARKGLADTALRTSDSGYLTRRLVDIAQDVLILEEDCGTTYGMWVTSPAGQDGPPLAERLAGRLAARPIADPGTGETIVDRNEEIDEAKANIIVSSGITEAYVRSPLSCQARRGLCQRCYGVDLARGSVVQRKSAVGIVAAQSIGEPGTQLTLRTFHTGGVAGVDITSGLPRVEELFEARVPKGQAIISEIDGTAQMVDGDDMRRVKIASAETYRDIYAVPAGMTPTVSGGERVDIGALLAKPAAEEPSDEETQGAVAPAPLLARVAGIVAIDGDSLMINYEERQEREYPIPAAATLKVREGDAVKAGQQVTEGHINPQDILRIQGKEAVQRYLVDEVQKVYRSQGVNINDKHIEVIVRQMLRRVRIDSPGDTRLLPGRLVDRFEYEDINAKVLSEGGEPATAQTVLSGITKASLNSDSFLAAASFQETSRVLAEAAINGKIDRLLGLKENVIIGRLIPARCLPDEAEDQPELALPEPEAAPPPQALAPPEPDEEDDDELDTEADGPDADFDAQLDLEADAEPEAAPEPEVQPDLVNEAN